MSSTLVFALLALPFLVLGIVAGRWLVAALPLVVWPVVYAGLHEGWWGYGLGDGWPYAMGLVIGLSVVAAAVGVAVRKGASP